MSATGELYGHSFSMLVDLYELTMAYAYWKSGCSQKEAVFHGLYRSNPFQGGYCIAAGLAQVVDSLRSYRFTDGDVDYLAGLTGSDGEPLLGRGFLDELRRMALAVDVDAIPEGTIVFPHEPLIRVRGPILQCQILETALLNTINFQTLIATKASRVCHAAQGNPVLEFGARRAQGPDGSVSAARAAYVGGCAATSNVLAGRLHGIPVKGTIAHSWVQSFEDELEAFETYLAAMPNNSLLLVDTFDSLEGVRKACQAGRRLRERGYELAGVRLDSGDLAYLSIEARKILDAEGFPEAKIVASGSLDEYAIASLKDQGAKIDIWGVGTKLSVARDDPALDGIYKLSAVRRPGDKWRYRLKLSQQSSKTSTPGILQVRRFRDDSKYIADMIYDEKLGPADGGTIVDPADMTRRKHIPADAVHEELLVPVMRNGEVIYDPPTADAARDRAAEQLRSFDPGMRRFVEPYEYPAGLEKDLFQLKTRLILEARGMEE